VSSNNDSVTEVLTVVISYRCMMTKLTANEIASSYRLVQSSLKEDLSFFYVVFTVHFDNIQQIHFIS
jgi:hypothetical protein